MRNAEFAEKNFYETQMAIGNERPVAFFVI